MFCMLVWQLVLKWKIQSKSLGLGSHNVLHCPVTPCRIAALPHREDRIHSIFAAGRDGAMRHIVNLCSLRNQCTFNLYWCKPCVCTYVCTRVKLSFIGWRTSLTSNAIYSTCLSVWVCVSARVCVCGTLAKNGCIGFPIAGLTPWKIRSLAIFTVLRRRAIVFAYMCRGAGFKLRYNHLIAREMTSPSCIPLVWQRMLRICRDAMRMWPRFGPASERGVVKRNCLCFSVCVSFARLFIPACIDFQLAVYCVYVRTYIRNGMYSAAADVIMSSCRNPPALAFVCEQKKDSSSHIQGWGLCSGNDGWSVGKPLALKLLRR